MALNRSLPQAKADFDMPPRLRTNGFLGTAAELPTTAA